MQTLSKKSTCRWKASRIVQAALLTRGRWKRSWSRELAGNRRPTGRQGTSEVTRAAPSEKKTLRWGGRPARAARRLVSRKGDAGGPCVARNRSWSCAVKRQANRGRIAARWSGATQENCASIVARGRASERGSRRCTGKTCGVDAAKVACSVVERFTGARVVSRLQKSVRSIFPDLQRGEPQGKPRESGVARTLGSSPGRGRVEGSGRKGARSVART